MKLSVVIPCYNSAATIVNTIPSVLVSIDGLAAEVIVVDSGTDKTSRLIAADYPQVRLIKSDIQLLPGAARNLGWRAAVGEIVAFLDADCVVSDDWAAKILEAHEGLDAVGVSGSFSVYNPDDLCGQIVFAAELGASLSGLAARYTHLAPSGNTSYKRFVLEEAGGFAEDRWCEDTILAAGLIEKGYKIFFEPTINVAHINREGWAALKAAMHRSGYHSAQARYFNQMRGSAVAHKPYLIPLLFPYRVLNFYKTNMAGRNAYMSRLYLALPLVLLAMLIWTVSFAQGVIAARKSKQS